MGFLLATGYLILLLIWIRKSEWFRPSELPVHWINAAFLIRVLAGFALMAIYSYHYTVRENADTWKYFDDAMTIRSWWKDDPSLVWRFLSGVDLNAPDMTHWKDHLHGWNTKYTYGLPYDYHTIVRINLLLSLFSFGHYEVHAVFFAMMGFVGSMAVFHAFKDYVFRKKWLFLIVSLCPSLIFWTSGAIKESPSWMALGVFLLSFFRIIENRATRGNWIMLAGSVALLIVLKPYVGICMVPSLLSIILWRILNRKWLVVSFLSVHLISLGVAVTASWFYPAGDLIYVLQKRRADFYNVAEQEKAGSTIHIPAVEKASDLILFLPEAFSITYLRPYIWEANNAMMRITSLENGFYLIAVFLAFLFFRIPARSSQPALLLALSFALINAVIIGFSVPILGAIVRYRFAGLAFLLIALLMIAGKRWPDTIFSSSKKASAIGKAESHAKKTREER